MSASRDDSWIVSLITDMLFSGVQSGPIGTQYIEPRLKCIRFVRADEVESLMKLAKNCSLNVALGTTDWNFIAATTMLYPDSSSPGSQVRCALETQHGSSSLSLIVRPLVTLHIKNTANNIPAPIRRLVGTERY